MVICGNRYYSSFEELGDDMLASLPKKRQSVKWWRGWHIVVWHHKNWMAKTAWQKIKIWLPHFSKSRSWVGYFWLNIFLFNKWDVMFTCGYYKEEDKMTQQESPMYLDTKGQWQLREQELREKIARKYWLSCLLLTHPEILPSEWDESDFDYQTLIDKQPYYNFAGQILALIKEALPELAKEAGYLPPESVIKITGIDLEECFLTVSALEEWAFAHGYVKLADVIEGEIEVLGDGTVLDLRRVKRVSGK